MSNGLIFIVDDERDTIEFIQIVFSKRGYEVVGMQQAWDGLRFARERQPDVILIDVMLPGISGFELCRQLRSDQQTAHIPLVVLSARNSAADRAEAQAAGARYYLVKPVSIKTLTGVIEELISRNLQFPV
jgi:DNA-binding response OmpR family regulator